MKYKCFVVIFLLLILLPGCLLKKDKNISSNDWQNEVLMAQECGLDGLPCCVDKNKPCQYELNCCVNPTDNKQNYCATKCEFGTKDQFCRTSNPFCDEGLSCAESYCKPCGEKNNVCCTDNKCNNDLVCHQNKCVECGIPNNPCCTKGKACQNEEKKNENRSECQNNICILCGTENELACQKEPLCNKGNLLNNNVCYLCGGFNQPCCQKGELNNYECDESAGLRCDLGFCAK
jgi:hypothetical protein